MARDEIITDKQVELMLFVLKVLKNMGELYPRLSFDAKAAITRLFLVELRVDGRRIYLQSKPELEGLLKSAQYISGGLSCHTLRAPSHTFWRELAEHLRRIVFGRGGLAAAFRQNVATIFAPASHS